MGYIPFYDGKLGNVLTIAANPANRWIPADYDDPSIPASMRENPNAMFPRLSYGSNQNNAQASTFWKGNRKYLRLDEISLNYNWNCNLLKSIGINSIDLAVVANDLHTWDSVNYSIRNSPQVMDVLIRFRAALVFRQLSFLNMIIK